MTISYLGKREEFRDRLGVQEVHVYKCLECKQEMATNVHWGEPRDRRRPTVCVHCLVKDSPDGGAVGRA